VFSASSFLQSVCVLGYCIAPLNVASIFCYIWGNKIYQLILVGTAFAWAVRGNFMTCALNANRCMLLLLFFVRHCSSVPRGILFRCGTDCLCGAPVCSLCWIHGAAGARRSQVSGRVSRVSILFDHLLDGSSAIITRLCCQQGFIDLRCDVYGVCTIRHIARRPVICRIELFACQTEGSLH